MPSGRQNLLAILWFAVAFILGCVVGYQYSEEVVVMSSVSAGLFLTIAIKMGSLETWGFSGVMCILTIPIFILMSLLSCLLNWSGILRF